MWKVQKSHKRWMPKSFLNNLNYHLHSRSQRCLCHMISYLPRQSPLMNAKLPDFQKQELNSPYSRVPWISLQWFLQWHVRVNGFSSESCHKAHQQWNSFLPDGETPITSNNKGNFTIRFSVFLSTSGSFCQRRLKIVSSPIKKQLKWGTGKCTTANTYNTWWIDGQTSIYLLDVLFFIPAFCFYVFMSTIHNSKHQ